MSDSRRLRAIRLVGLASWLLRRDRLDRAAELLDLAERLAPELIRLRVERGRLATLRGDTAAAIAELRRAREVDPFDEDIAELLAGLLEQAGERTSAAECLADAELLGAGVDEERAADIRARLESVLAGEAEPDRARQALLARRAARLEELELEACTEAEAVEPDRSATGGAAGGVAAPRGSVLDKLDAGQLASLEAILERVTKDAGEVVFEEGQESEDVFLVESGVVRIQRQTPFGTQQLGTVAAGGLFGEINFIDGRSRSADAVVAEPAVLLRLPNDRLAELFESDARLAARFLRDFWRGLAAKIREGNELMKTFFEEEGTKPGEQPTGVDGDTASAEKAPERTRSGGRKAGVGAREKAGLLHERGMTSDQLTALAALATARDFEVEDAIFREGDEGEALYVVLDGKVRISKHIPGVGEEALAILERGDFFGEMAVVSREARSASAIAHAPGTTVLRFNQRHVERLLEEDVEAARPFLEELCRLLSARLREINDKIVQWRMMSGGF